MTTLDLKITDLLIDQGLTKSNTLFREFMHHSPMIACVVDAEGFMQYANPSFLKTFEPLTEVIGKNIFELYPHDFAKEYFENNKKVIETENTIETIEKSKTIDKNNSYKVIKFPVVYKGRKMVAAWAIDITAQMETFETCLY